MIFFIKIRVSGFVCSAVWRSVRRTAPLPPHHVGNKATDITAGHYQQDTYSISKFKTGQQIQNSFYKHHANRTLAQIESIG